MSSEKQSESVSVSLDSLTVAAFEKFLREGLVASGAASQADNQNLTINISQEVSVELDPKTSAKISELLINGLVASGAASQADNENVALMINKVNEDDCNDV